VRLQAFRAALPGCIRSAFIYEPIYPQGGTCIGRHILNAVMAEQSETVQRPIVRSRAALAKPSGDRSSSHRPISQNTPSKASFASAKLVSIEASRATRIASISTRHFSFAILSAANPLFISYFCLFLDFDGPRELIACDAPAHADIRRTLDVSSPTSLLTVLPRALPLISGYLQWTCR
jgi:hypothetical protein